MGDVKVVVERFEDRHVMMRAMVEVTRARSVGRVVSLLAYQGGIFDARVGEMTFFSEDEADVREWLRAIGEACIEVSKSAVSP